MNKYAVDGFNAALSAPQQNNITFYASMPAKEVMRISLAGVTVPEGVHADEAAKVVLEVLDSRIKEMVAQAVGDRDELVEENKQLRERLVQALELAVAISRDTDAIAGAMLEARK